MTNSTNNISSDISMNVQNVKGGDQFQVLGSNSVQRWHLLSRNPHQDCLSNGSNGKIKQDRRSNTINFASKLSCISLLSRPSSSMAVKHRLFLLTLKKRIQAFETKCPRKLSRFSFLEYKTNDWVQGKIIFLAGPREPLLATVKREKLAWFGHVTRHDSLSKIIVQGISEGGRRRDRQKKCWMDNVKEWTSLLCQTCSQRPPRKRLEENLC